MFWGTKLITGGVKLLGRGLVKLSGKEGAEALERQAVREGIEQAARKAPAEAAPVVAAANATPAPGWVTRNLKPVNDVAHWLVHKQLVKVSKRAETWVADKLNRLGFNVCFAAGTPLRTPEGSRNIEKFGVGDLVLSRDENNPDSPIEAKVVEEVFVREGLLTRLRANGHDILTTDEHPFFVADRGWVPCNQLKVGEKLLTESGAWVTVEAVEDTGEWATVYNLRVADFHTYFVGCDEWGFSVWAHNQYTGPLKPTDLVREATALSKTQASTTTFRNRIIDSVFNKVSSAGSALFDRLGITFGRKLNLTAASDATGANRSYFTYVFKDKQTGKVVYVGRGSGAGTPEQALQARLVKPHKRYDPKIHDAEIVDVHGSKLAGQGAEEVYLLGFRERGPLINDDPALSYLTNARAKDSLDKLQSFADEVAGR